MNENKCLFCHIEKKRVIAENDLAFAIYDGFPVTELHSLIIPKRHIDNYFGLTQEEVLACNELIHQLKTTCINNDDSIEGFNVGMNCGEVAGQTIFHCHTHLIPRRIGDVEFPIGGVRNVIPGKGTY